MNTGGTQGDRLAVSPPLCPRYTERSQPLKKDRNKPRRFVAINPTYGILVTLLFWRYEHEKS